MPKTQSESDKKHGDELQSLIERTGGKASPRKPKERPADDDPTELVADDDDPVSLEDDDEEDDEDVQDDDVASYRDVGEPD